MLFKKQRRSCLSTFFGTDEILQAIHDAGFQVAIQKEMTLSEEQAREFYKEHEGQDYLQSLINHMTR